MSKKTDMLIVGTLSAALFTGFTAYNHVAGKGKTAALPPQAPAVAAPAAVPPPTKFSQVPADSQVAPPADPAPANVTRTKNTKTKAS